MIGLDIIDYLNLILEKQAFKKESEESGSFYEGMYELAKK